jgi:hypothetical protein
MFQEFSSNPVAKEKGYFKLVLNGLPPLNVVKEPITQPGESHSTKFSCTRDSKGFVQLNKEQSQEIEFSSFPLPKSKKKSWSREDLKKSWEEMLKSPPEDMTYVIGDPLFPDIKLSSGKGLEKRGVSELPGIGTTYAYLGFDISGSSIHGEDAEFSSINLLRSGASKFWLFIEPAYKDELEFHMRREFPEMGTCSQALRHLSRFIPPSKLDAWGIPYSLDYINPGEAIVTLPRTLYQVQNDGTNYAIATNILCNMANAIPEGYRFCQESCGPYAIERAHLQLREQRTATKTKPTQSTASLDTQPPQVRMKRKTTTHPIRPENPKKLKITPQVQLLSKLVCGKEAFYRLSALVHISRNPSRSFKISGSAQGLVLFIVNMENRTMLDQVSVRIAKVQLAEIIDNGKEGRINADPGQISKLLDELSWGYTKENRRRLHDMISAGRKWKQIRGTFDGLLCLIPTRKESGIFGSTYHDLCELDIQKFHSLLARNKPIKSLCQVGKIIEWSILNEAEFPQFKWESEDSQRIEELSIEELVPFIEESFP